MYLTKVKLNNIERRVKIENITTSDNLEYGTNEMYTQETGELYLYLPEGTRIIAVRVNGIEYSSEITTKAENSEIITTLY